MQGLCSADKTRVKEPCEEIGGNYGLKSPEAIVFYIISVFAVVWLGLMAFYYYTNPSPKLIYKISIFVLTICFQLTVSAIAVKFIKNCGITALVAANIVFFVLYCFFYFAYYSKKLIQAPSK